MGAKGWMAVKKLVCAAESVDAVTVFDLWTRLLQSVTA